MKYRQDLHTLIAPAVEAAGVQLWGVEYLPQGAHSVLRIYIDKPEGITVEDCEAASRQVSALLDVEDPINGTYNLEVSSPGIDRPLFMKEQFAQLQGQKVAMQLLVAANGKRKLQGVIDRVSEDNVVMRVEEELLTIPFSNISKANLVVEI